MFNILCKHLFTDEEVDFIIKECSSFLSLEETNRKFALNDIRKARFGSFTNFEILQETIINKLKPFGIISLDKEEINFVKYEKGHFFKKHVDTLKETKQRPFKTDSGISTEQQKLNEPRLYTLVIQLSDENEYEGGTLIVDNKPYPKEKGTVIIFRSDILHEVTEITNGSRMVFTNFLRKSNTNFFNTNRVI